MTSWLTSSNPNVIFNLELVALQAFSCLLLLTKNRAVKGYRMLTFRVVFEFLQVREPPFASSPTAAPCNMQSHACRQQPEGDRGTKGTNAGRQGDMKHACRQAGRGKLK